MNKIIIKESQLMEMIKESVIKHLSESEPDEYYIEPDVPDCCSKVTIYFDQDSLEPCEKNNDSAWVEVESKDFPSAWIGEYDSECGYQECDCGECMGYDLEIVDCYIPNDEDLDAYDVAMEFVNKNKEYVLKELTDYAEFC